MIGQTGGGLDKLEQDTLESRSAMLVTNNIFHNFFKKLNFIKNKY